MNWMANLKMWVLPLALALGALACGGEEEPEEQSENVCMSFCGSLGCPAESAMCDSSSSCACPGCEAFYEVYYTDTNPGGGPAC